MLWTARHFCRDVLPKAARNTARYLRPSPIDLLPGNTFRLAYVVANPDVRRPLRGPNCSATGSRRDPSLAAAAARPRNWSIVQTTHPRRTMFDVQEKHAKRGWLIEYGEKNNTLNLVNTAANTNFQ